ncbi:flagellar hook-basal body protein [Eshraghiella crossota]|uniref:flagellar hook-basal body protein n=1 Tax=Eshraghiella crossota TaxID=45851 RepID=UPI003F804F9A
MMRALYTAASGMIAQQTNVDVISNNLANVNSTGYKASTAEFKSLLYQTLQSRSTSANGDDKPIPAQVGTGARTAAITTHFSQGSLIDSTSTFAFGLEGDGLFGLMNPDGEIVYTRNGDFTVGKTNDDGFMICSSDGYPVVDSDGNPIQFSGEYDVSNLVITSDGLFYYRVIEEQPDENGNMHKTERLDDLETRMGVFQFTNPSGLDSIGSSLYKETEASGIAMEEGTYTELKRTKVCQGRLEASNVQVADEMVNLIVAQRAYEMNSKAIQAADDMLGQANQLKR